MSAAGLVDWTVFWIGVVVLLAVDFITARDGKRASVRSAAAWSGVWIGFGLALGGWVAMRFGADAAIAYLTAFTLEKSLSVDNLFVFALIFSRTGIPAPLQHRALFWGIAGALVMRAIMIGLGVYLLARFHWVVYPFAAILAYSAVRMLRGQQTERKLADADRADFRAKQHQHHFSGDGSQNLSRERVAEDKLQM
jgi:tellurite resistance protein TerC